MGVAGRVNGREAVESLPFEQKCCLQCAKGQGLSESPVTFIVSL
jgi:hypothetical protein